MENFKIKRYKTASEVEWLKDIHLALVNKYYQDITEYHDELRYDIGDSVRNSLGEDVGEIIDIIYNLEEECKESGARPGVYALIELYLPVDFDTLIQLGVPIENIVFDCNFGLLDGEKELGLMYDTLTSFEEY